MLKMRRYYLAGRLSFVFAFSLMLGGCVDVDQTADIDTTGRMTFRADLAFDTQTSKLAGANPPAICKESTSPLSPPFASRKVWASKQDDDRWICHIELIINDVRAIDGTASDKSNPYEKAPFSLTSLPDEGIRVDIDLLRKNEKTASQNNDVAKMTASLSNIPRAMVGDHHFSLKINAPRIGRTNGTSDGTTAEWNYALADVLDDSSSVPDSLFAEVYLDAPWYRQLWDWMLSSPLG